MERNPGRFFIGFAAAHIAALLVAGFAFLCLNPEGLYVLEPQGSGYEPAPASLACRMAEGVVKTLAFPLFYLPRPWGYRNESWPSILIAPIGNGLLWANVAFYLKIGTRRNQP
jgi:hypothetical protein